MFANTLEESDFGLFGVTPQSAKWRGNVHGYPNACQGLCDGDATRETIFAERLHPRVHARLTKDASGGSKGEVQIAGDLSLFDCANVALSPGLAKLRRVPASP